MIPSHGRTILHGTHEKRSIFRTMHPLTEYGLKHAFQLNMQAYHRANPDVI